MKLALSFAFLFYSILITAQTFVEASFTPFLPHVENSSIAISDIDGDGDKDVLIAGQNFFDPITKLFTNDGHGNFTEMMDTPFEGVRDGAIAIADFDGDGTQDVFITGDNGMNPIAKLYTNDGFENFTEMIGTPFEGVKNSSVAISDFDGDNDNDILITGMNNTSRITSLYINDGKGDFLEQMDTPFEGVFFSSLAVSDIDNDNDTDILITGLSNSFKEIAKLYTNDGKGNFIQKFSPFEGVWKGAVAFADLDGDNDQDVFITGQGNPSKSAKPYINNGEGDFFEMTIFPHIRVMNSSIAISDIDGDNDNDVLITGRSNSNNPIAKLYINDGKGNFTELMDVPFEGIQSGSVAIFDADNDNDNDVLITGQSSPKGPVTKLLINTGLTTSISEHTNFSRLELALFPNPNKTDWVNITFNSTENTKVSINIFDLNGRLIKQYFKQSKIGVQHFSLDTSSLEKGSYMLQLINDSKIGIEKLFVH